MKRCRFEDVGMGVFTNYSGSSDYYIADSEFIGRNDPRHLTGWTGPFWAAAAAKGPARPDPARALRPRTATARIPARRTMAGLISALPWMLDGEAAGPGEARPGVATRTS